MVEKRTQENILYTHEIPSNCVLKYANMKLEITKAVNPTILLELREKLKFFRTTNN